MREGSALLMALFSSSPLAMDSTDPIPRNPRHLPTADVSQFSINEVLLIIQDRIEILFPQLKDVDMDNVYISELENLIDGFLEVNFSMMKKVFMKVTTMM